MWILLIVVCVVFLLGLLQWARSGAILWDIHLLMKRGQPADEADLDARERAAARESARESRQRTIRNMEAMMDGFLRSSLRILGLLAICVWAFVIFSVIVDALGLNWLDRVSFSAHRAWSGPTTRAFSRSTPNFRNDTLRSLGSGVRR